MDKIVSQVKRSLDFYQPRNVSPKELSKVFYGRLNGALGPAVLLAFKVIHPYWQFCRTDHTWRKLHLPSFELSPVTEVKVFREGIRLPTPGIFDGLFAPD